ncbi:MAG: NAD(P)-binding protein [Myxococcales bacterium]|nr:NAD(P)-binding protein [Myxococcales bacterium]
MASPVQGVDVLVAGAGMTGLGVAAFLREAAPEVTVQVVEQASEPGGYCRTVVQDGFTWDYAGHFFHFRHPEMDAWIHRDMAPGSVATIVRQAKIAYGDVEVDFPFQRHIHQLPRQDFLACLADLYHRPAAGTAAAGSFYDFLAQQYGPAISERFLIPYNEKLYACDLQQLDADAMGRFFPHTEFADVMAQIARDASGGAQGDGAGGLGYNATFRYPRGGAVQYVRALHDRRPPDALHCDEALVRVDLAQRVAVTSKRTVSYRHLASSLPLPALAALCGLKVEPGVFSANRVLVFNLGFDRKGRPDLHWLYVPDRAISFYRVGWYDNMYGDDRMSLYIEIGLPSDGAPIDVEAQLARVLADLATLGITAGHRLVAHHHVVLDPAYVHISGASISHAAALISQLAAHGVHSVGRYGAWTYCSIEDNLVEAKALAAKLARGDEVGA